MLPRQLSTLAVLAVCSIASLAQAEPLPEVLASVRFGNGSCSGTIITVEQQHAYGLTAAHCCNSVGERYTVHYTDGSRSTAKIIARDASVDLALFAVPADAAIGSVPVTVDDIGGDKTAIGFPGGFGPNRKQLTYLDAANIQGNLPRWKFSVGSGTFRGGDSGGGVFSGGPSLIGVTSHQDQFNNLYSARHDQVVTFLVQNRRKCPDCGDRSDSWWLKPNVEVPGRSDSSTASKELLNEFKRFQKDVDQRLQALESPCGPGGCPLPDRIIDGAIDHATQPLQAGLGTLILVALLIGGVIYFIRR